MYQRSSWVDDARAFGIILVVYGHVARGVYREGININENLYKLIDSIIYSFHMPLFFFLSGLFFIFSLEKRGSAGLIYSKIDTIVYPYLIWSLIQELTKVVLYSYTNGDESFSGVFSLLWPPLVQFWFLYALFMDFVLASIIFEVFRKKHLTTIVITLSAALYIFQFYLPKNFHYEYIANSFIFFMFGVEFKKIKLSNDKNIKLPLFFLAVCFIISQYVFHECLGLTHINKGLASLSLALISIMFIVYTSMALSHIPNKFILFLGKSSMAVFLMHILAGSGVRVILKRVGVDSGITHLVIGTIIGIFGPLLAVYAINTLNIPFMFSAPISKLIKKNR